ncbi:MAG: helix-turn-helix domain-containing protein [Fimbriimonas sp.]
MRLNAMDETRRHLERSIEPLVEGTPLDPGELADRAAYSRHHFHRVFLRIMGETPGEMRRRLLLERAAWMLLKEGASATDAAFDVGFGSLEGFGRAFRRAFGILPSRYAAAELPLWLPTPNGVHYRPLRLLPEEKPMDLIDRLLATEAATLRRLLTAAKTLPDADLDGPLPTPVQILAFEAPETTVRALLDGMIYSHEVWLAAVERQPFPTNRDKSVDGLIARAEISLPMFAALVRRVRDADEWDTVFVDELCDPPERFTFGGMIAHVLTHNTHRRQTALHALRRLGREEIGWGDPIDIEREG